MDLSIEDIKEVYAKLGISVDQNGEKGNCDFGSLKSDFSQFGIYTEGGFNFTNNTNFNSKQR
jgi:hypothetical protein